MRVSDDNQFQASTKHVAPLKERFFLLLGEVDMCAGLRPCGPPQACLGGHQLGGATQGWLVERPFETDPVPDNCFYWGTHRTKQLHGEKRAKK